jgi:hypothetical protein
VQEHRHLPLSLFHRHALRRVLEPPLLHQLQKLWRVPAARVGEDGLAARREQRGDEIREGGGVTPLVENVCGGNEVEGPRALWVVPVEERGLRLAAEVRPGVMGREFEGAFVVVGRENSSAAREGNDGGEPDAAPELDDPSAGQILARQISGQGDRARPQLGPVGQPLVAVEVFVVDQGVRRGGMQDPIGSLSGLDEGFGETGPGAEVRPECVQRIAYQPTEAASRAARSSRSAAASWAML